MRTLLCESEAAIVARQMKTMKTSKKQLQKPSLVVRVDHTTKGRTSSESGLLLFVGFFKFRESMDGILSMVMVLRRKFVV